MTYEEVTKEILAVCRQESVSKPLMLYSVNQAINEIYSRRHILRTVRLFATGTQPTLYHRELYCKTGSSIVLPLKGRCYSMRISGEGLYEIIDGATTTVTEFHTGPESQLIRGFIKEGGQIAFYGRASFIIFDFSLYDECFGTTVKDIPDGRARVNYDIRGLYNDFLAFHSPPTDGHDAIIENARLFDGTLQVPADYRGEIELTYRVQPPIVEGTLDDEIVDIPPEYNRILILIAAYHYRIDEDEPTALLFKAEYENLFNLLNTKSYQSMGIDYKVENGWA